MLWRTIRQGKGAGNTEVWGSGCCSFKECGQEDLTDIRERCERVEDVNHAYEGK